MIFIKHRLALAISCLLTTPYTFSAEPVSAKSGVDVLSGFNQLWQLGRTWNSGTPTLLGQSILETNVNTVIDIAKKRTQQQEIEAFEFDAQNANYAIIQGLGPLSGYLKQETGAFTTVQGIPKEAYSGRISDKGNGLGSSTKLSDLIKLVDTVRYPASTTPAKNAYNYPRPFRQTLNGENLSWVLQPSLVARVPATGEGDGGFPSGHTNAAYLAALTVAYTVPQQYSDLVLRAGEIGYSRVVAGIHSPLDVIGGRMHATYYTIDGLAKNPELRKAAYQQAQQFFAQQCGGNIAGCYSSQDLNQTYQIYQANKARYDQYTFAHTFPVIGDASAAPIVPKNAELLIETRYPYLTAQQQREILSTTSYSRGGVLDNGLGYDTLNLYQAGYGYGALNQNTVIHMDAAQGGFSAADLWLNDISGTGRLEKTGTGQLTLAGHNTWSGGTNVLEGTLLGNNGQSFGQGEINNQANIIINNTTQEVMNNTWQGQGNFYKQGVGELIYQGDGRQFLGQTNIQQGRFNIQSTLAGKTVVENNGILTGKGQLENLYVMKGGVVDLGSSNDRLSVSNNLTIDQGAQLTVFTNSAVKDSSGIDVAGSITLRGGTVLHVGAGSNYNLLSDYQILTAKQGITGTFDQVSSNFSFLTPKLRYDAQAVTLQLLRNDKSFNTVAENNNQVQVANGLERLGFGQALYNTIAKQSEAQAKASFDQLSGEGYTALSLHATQDLLATSHMIAEQRNASNSVWMQSYGKQIKNNGSWFDSEYTNYGALVGAERQLNDTASIGAVLGQGRGHNKVADRYFSAKDNNTEFGIYARQNNVQSGVTLGLTGRIARADATRTINIEGLNAQASANVDVRSGQIFGEYWAKPDLVFPLEPYVRVSHIVTEVDSFREHDADIASLTGQKTRLNTTFSTIGLRTLYQLPHLSHDVTVHAGTGWTHAFGDLNGLSRLSFAGSQASYQVEGSQLAKDAAKINLGISTTLYPQLKVGLNYDGEFAQDVKQHRGTLVLNYNF